MEYVPLAVEIYNNGRGWRIAIESESGQRIALDRHQTRNLINKLLTALSRVDDKEAK
jgi:hypothetical protein